MLENINDYSLEDLKKIKKQVDQAINTHKSRAIANARKELEKTAKSLGFSLSEIVAIAPVKSKVAAKYANPEDPSQTWTGRGRKPRWVEALIQKRKHPQRLRDIDAGKHYGRPQGHGTNHAKASARLWGLVHKRLYSPEPVNISCNQIATC